MAPQWSWRTGGAGDSPAATHHHRSGARILHDSYSAVHESESPPRNLYPNPASLKPRRFSELKLRQQWSQSFESERRGRKPADSPDLATQATSPAAKPPAGVAPFPAAISTSQRRQHKVLASDLDSVSSADAQIHPLRPCSPSQSVSPSFLAARGWRRAGGSRKAGPFDPVARSWADVVRGPARDKVEDPGLREEFRRALPWVPAGEANSSLPSSTHLAQTDRSLAFKSWARGRCYRCLARDHQVRSYKDSFRCIHCRCPGHRERHCRLRTPSLSPQVHSNENLQHPQSTQSLQQSQQSIDKVANPACCNFWCNGSHASTSLDPKSMATSLLNSLRSELELLIEIHLKEVMRPVREELSTIKLWLACVATQLDCHEQDKEQVSASSIAELFGPCSPVQLPSISTILDSLAAAHTFIEPMGCKDTRVDNAKSITNQITPKTFVVDDENAISSSTLEILRETLVEQPLEVPTKTSTTQMHLVPFEKHKSVQGVAQVEDLVIVEDASDDKLTSDSLLTEEDPVGDGPTKVEDPMMIDFSSSDASTTMRDENFVISPTRTTTTRHRRKSCDKSSLRRSARRNILKDLGFIRKNGKLDEGKLQDFADLLKELLPPDLLLSLMRLKGRAFWETLAKIFDPLC